jgi:leucine dehydrogenase
VTTYLLERLAREGFEEVAALHDRRSGTEAWLALHDTSIGPAFGGVRRAAYRRPDDALEDCLRLARAMTEKCQLAGLAAGGGKVVLLDRPGLDRERAYRFIGEAVERLGGRFYTGPDVGTGEAELEVLASATAYAARPEPEAPDALAEATAAGVHAAIAAALVHVYGSEDWDRRTVLVQGLGAVGERVAELLCAAGAKVVGSELDAARAEAVGRRLRIDLVGPDRAAGQAAFEVPCDVFAPCALGGVLHDVSVARLRTRIVAGSANNQLAAPVHAEQLHARGVLFVPDSVASAGALIRGATWHLERRRVPSTEIGARIGRTTRAILGASVARGVSPARVAAEEAAARLERRRRQNELALLLKP